MKTIVAFLLSLALVVSFADARPKQKASTTTDSSEMLAQQFELLAAQNMEKAYAASHGPQPSAEVARAYYVGCAVSYLEAADMVRAQAIRKPSQVVRSR